MKLLQPSVFDFGVLAHSMREDEKRQWCALTGADEYDADAAAAYFIGLPGHKFVLVDDDGQPVAAGGYVAKGPGVWQSWMVGCDAAWGKHLKAVTRGARKVMQAMFDGGARRLETEACADRVQAHRWYARSLGMTQEGIHPGRYADGSAAISFGRVNNVPVSTQE